MQAGCLGLQAGCLGLQGAGLVRVGAEGRHGEGWGAGGGSSDRLGEQQLQEL